MADEATTTNDDIIDEARTLAERILQEGKELEEQAISEIPKSDKPPAFVVPKEVDVPDFKEFVTQFFPGLMRDDQPLTTRQKIFGAISDFFTQLDPQLSQEAMEKARLQQQKTRDEFNMVMSAFTSHQRGLQIEAENERARARIMNDQAQQMHDDLEDLTSDVAKGARAALNTGINLAAAGRTGPDRSKIKDVQKATSGFVTGVLPGLLRRPAELADVPDENKFSVQTAQVKIKDLFPNGIELTEEEKIDFFNGDHFKALLDVHNVDKQQIFTLIQARFPEAVSPSLTFDEWIGDHSKFPGGGVDEEEEGPFSSDDAEDELKIADIDKGVKAKFEQYPFRSVHTEQGYLELVHRQSDDINLAWAALILNAVEDGDVTRAVMDLGQPFFRQKIKNDGGSVREVLQHILNVANPAAEEG